MDSLLLSLQELLGYGVDAVYKVELVETVKRLQLRIGRV